MGKTHFGGVVVSDSYYHADDIGVNEKFQLITGGHKEGAFLIFDRTSLAVKGGSIVELKELPELKIKI